MLKYVLAATAAGAPLIGALFTVFGIIGSFKGGCDNPLDALGYIANDLGEALIPFAWALAVSILAKLTHGSPTARDKPSGAGIDIGAKQLFKALSRQQFRVPILHRGGLDTLPTVVHAANFIAAGLVLPALAYSFRDPWYFLFEILYNGTLPAFATAITVAQFTRLGYRWLDAQHRTLEAEME